jgi:hypothetical protein
LTDVNKPPNSCTLCLIVTSKLYMQKIILVFK